ncbi:MAG: dTDP-4-dehydrorhamnose 3,5-epimerase [Chloroflexota bacterium]|nr:dTDP-4-dehydrorhamnose 3,5-epimerase [Chloroflexota bacterium]PLS79081.1 MAG: dTDP-4-dehydrorhamnose 3,5-epimerase [Chloroflexota bacterium]
MIFTETELRGAYIIELEKREDERGFFARAWCDQEFAAHTLVSRFVQINVSSNKVRGTVRGLHFQRQPYAEVKVMRCTRGAIYDVIIDLRRDSPSYMRWIGVELSASNYRMLYVPEGFAHGYQALEDDSEVMYPVSEYYTPGAEGGIRYNDPAFGIEWPVDIRSISDKDRSWPDYVTSKSEE